MNGCIIKGTPIAVDYWRVPEKTKASLFFLTHLHSDHTKGLSSAWTRPLYTSPINAKLLLHLFKLGPDVVRALEVGETHILKIHPDLDEMITVTPLDANHIPGSVMFLFQGYFGNILYCGDIRYTPKMLENSILRSVVDNRELDCLYLDNTFCDPSCCFPSREDVALNVLQLIRDHPMHHIMLGVRKYIGKEGLLVEIAQMFKECIYVTEERMGVLKILGYPNVFTTNKEETRIWAVNLNKINKKTHLQWNQDFPTITVMLTAIYFGLKHWPYSSVKDFYVVPYSDHSSWEELCEFVQRLAPCTIRPIVTRCSKSRFCKSVTVPGSDSRCNMALFESYLTPGQRKLDVPDEIKSYLAKNIPSCSLKISKKKRLKKNVPKKATMKGVNFATVKVTLEENSQVGPSTGTIQSLCLKAENNDVVGIYSEAKNFEEGIAVPREESSGSCTTCGFIHDSATSAKLSSRCIDLLQEFNNKSDCFHAAFGKNIDYVKVNQLNSILNDIAENL